MATPAVRDTKCDGCGMTFLGEKGVALHQTNSTLCPKSAKYNAESAKEKDTKCTFCQLPCRGEEGLAGHLRRSRTCPGGRIAIAIKEGKPIEKKEKKPVAKKDDKKKDEKKTDAKKTDKKDAKTDKKGEKKTEKKGEKTEKKSEKKTEKKEKKELPPAELVTCDGCKAKFTEKSLSAHQTNSTTCPKSAKFTKEAAEKKDKMIAARKEANEARKQAKIAARDTECTHCKTTHKGEKGLATHLAKSTTCPGSAKYVKA